MPSRISAHFRARIVTLYRSGYSKRDVWRMVRAEGASTSYRGILGIISRFERTASLADRRRPGGPKKHIADLEEIINRHLKQNDELTASDLQQIIFTETGERISLTRIKVARRKAGWVCTGTNYCQLVRRQNRQKRLIFALNCLSRNKNFERVIFSYKRSVELDQHAKLTF